MNDPQFSELWGIADIVGWPGIIYGCVWQETWAAMSTVTCRDDLLVLQ